jgi:bacillithiol system protein YtxJ
MAATARQSLRGRFFALHHPGDVDALLGRHAHVALFKAGTSDKTFEAWEVVQRALEPRHDVPVGFMRLPEDRAASDHVAARTGVAHRSPQWLLVVDGAVVAGLDEFAITPDRVLPLLRAHLPALVGPAVYNPAVATLAPYIALIDQFLAGTLPDERFQWNWLDRLARDAVWRDDDSFGELDRLFPNAAGRALEPARVIAAEFQAQLAGRLEPLGARAARVRQRLVALQAADGARGVL